MSYGKRQRLYGTWFEMRSRCYESDDASFAKYGGRGIRVCKRWIDSTLINSVPGKTCQLGFQNFYDDMQKGWFPGATIHRIDNDGDYTSENCVWATREENNREMNQRRVEEGSHNLLGKGKPKSEEWKANMRKPKRRIVCGVCGKSVAINCINRHKQKYHE